MYYARITQFLFPMHDTADTQRHSGNNLYIYIYMLAIGCFTVTSHAETHARLLRLVGKTVKLVAIFVMFTL